MLARGTHKADGTPRKVGIITFKDVVEDCKAALTEVGYQWREKKDETQIVTGYYYNLRGDNDFTDCDMLVVLGYPIPNGQGLYEEACALYQDAPQPITREPKFADDWLELLNCHKVKVRGIRGYQDDRLHRLHLQKSRWELYQAFHRSRPLLKGEDGGVTEVLVFTDVPITGVPVVGFIGREGKVFDTLSMLLAASLPLPDGSRELDKARLVDMVLARHPGLWPTRDALDRWIRRAPPWLQEATGSKYEAGKFLVSK